MSRTRHTLEVGLGLILAFLAGYLSHRPPAAPTVQLHQVAQLRELELGKFAFQRDQGPVRVVERWRAPAAPGCPPVERERVEERGPARTVAQAETTRQATQATRLDLQVVPPPSTPRASWAVSAGLQLLPERKLELGLEHRLLGPVWGRAWLLQPAELAAPAVGVGLRVEW